MATALTYIHDAEQLLKAATEPGVNGSYASRQIAAAAVYADLAKAYVEDARLKLLRGFDEPHAQRLMDDLLLPDGCTCSSDGRETHPIGYCPDNPEEDAS